MYLAQNIRHLRLTHHDSQEDLASKLGYRSFTTIQKWESGVAQPPVEIIKKLCEIYHVSLNDIINRNIQEEGKEFEEKMAFDNVQAAMEFILKQEMVANYGGYDLKKMEDDDLVDMANDMADFLKMIAKRRKYI